VHSGARVNKLLHQVFLNCVCLIFVFKHYINYEINRINNSKILYAWERNYMTKEMIPKICLRTFLILIWSHIFIVFSSYFISCMICKYQDLYFIPSYNLQSMTMYVQWLVYIYSSHGSQTWLRSPMSSQTSQTCKYITNICSLYFY
jgi:hypothetical protein